MRPSRNNCPPLRTKLPEKKRKPPSIVFAQTLADPVLNTTRKHPFRRYLKIVPNQVNYNGLGKICSQNH